MQVCTKIDEINLKKSFGKNKSRCCGFNVQFKTLVTRLQEVQQHLKRTEDIMFKHMSVLEDPLFFTGHVLSTTAYRA